VKKVFAATFLLIFCAFTVFDTIFSYPIDGYALTGIRRLERLRKVLAGEIKGTMPIKGAQKSIADIKLNLLGARGDSLEAFPPVDPALQKKIEALFPNRDESYSLAVLDITSGKPLRLALHQADWQFSPGSVGKLAVVAGLFTELQRLFPDSVEMRRTLLRNRLVVADKWIRSDEHEVPIYDPETGKYAFRPVKEGDIFSLYEWADHMLSASANSAASTVWKEMILMRAFGQNYPPTPEQEQEFFAKTPKKDLQTLAMSVVNDPLRTIGISDKEWQLGSFFTYMATREILGGQGSFASPRAMLKYLVALERGKIVDEWSSLEIKRLMYMTARRIRYASAPRLASAAVYFKSGSLYRCKAEPDYECGKYKGNVENGMNSVAIVEHPEGRTYLVALMSNVLRKNSAVEHQSLATFIDKILAK